MTVQDLVGKEKAPNHESFGNLGEENSSHLFWKLLADVGKPLNCSQQGFCRDFLWFFFLPNFPQPVFVLRLLGWHVVYLANPAARFYTLSSEVKQLKPEDTEQLWAWAPELSQKICFPSVPSNFPSWARVSHSAALGEVFAFPAAAICNWILDFFLTAVLRILVRSTTLLVGGLWKQFPYLGRGGPDTFPPLRAAPRPRQQRGVASSLCIGGERRFEPSCHHSSPTPGLALSVGTYIIY